MIFIENINYALPYVRQINVRQINVPGLGLS